MDILQISPVRKMPLLRLFVPVVLGIILGDKLVVDFVRCIEPLVLVLILFFVLTILGLRFLNGRIFKTMLVDFFILYFFLFLTVQKQSFIAPEKFSGTGFGVVCEAPAMKANSVGMGVVLETQGEGFSFNKRQYKVKLYSAKDSTLLERFQIGDRIMFKGDLKEIRNNGNPYEFDYQQYMKRKGYYYQVFVADSLMCGFGNSNTMPLKRYANRVKRKIIESFHGYPFIDGSKALLIALTVGNKEFISDEMQASFQNAGATHLIAISGLHAGIIFMMLNFMLGFLDKRRGGRAVRILVSLLVLWFYASITGLAPSVVRASTMFSIAHLAKLWQRDTSFFNVLAATALLMVLNNPLVVFDVGFQLSFLAVGGIVYFQPLIYNWFYMPNKLTNYFYKLLTVSIAAQLATAPLTMFYFHQFPLYFWLSNFLLIPLVFGLLIGTLVFVVFSGVSIISSIIGFCLNYAALIANKWIEIVDGIPYSVIPNINYNALIVVGVYILIVSTTIWLLKRRSGALKLSLLVLAMLLVVDFMDKQQLGEEVVVYNSNGETAVGIFTSNKNVFYYASAKQKPPNFEYATNNHWVQRGIKGEVEVCNKDSLFHGINGNRIPVLVVGSNRLLFYDRNMPGKEYKLPENIDVLIVGQNKYPPKEKVTAKIIILDSSNKWWNIEKWKDYAKEYNLNLKIVAEEGAISFNV